jgi:hypothetical protein
VAAINKLTDHAIRNAKPGSKPIRLADGVGLYLEVSVAGAKLSRWKYRFGGKEKRLGLGKYDETSLKEARERCSAARKLHAAGILPRCGMQGREIQQGRVGHRKFRGRRA